MQESAGSAVAAIAVGKGVGAANAAPVLLAGSAADSTMRDALSRGATDGQALGAGLLAGTVETAMEKLSIDSLINLKSPSVLLNMLKQAGVEGSEEFLTTLANGAMDVLVMGDKSQLNLNKQRYEAMDFAPGEAERLALRDFGKQALTDALSGMISGGATAFGKASIDASYELADTIKNWDGWDNFNNSGWNGFGGLQWQSPYGQPQLAFAGVGTNGFGTYNGWVSDTDQNSIYMVTKRENANSLESRDSAEYNNHRIVRSDKKQKQFQRDFIGYVTSDEFIYLSKEEKSAIKHALKTGYGQIDASGEYGGVNTYEYYYLFRITEDNGVSVVDVIDHDDINIHNKRIGGIYSATGEND